MVQKVDSWSTFKLVVRQLGTPEAKEKFSVIGIDTVAIAYDLCEQYICSQNGVQKISEIPYGGGYSQLSKEFEGCLRKITMMGYGLILTTHLKEQSDDEGNIVGYKPDLNNRCLKIVNGLVDVIGVITQDWDEKGQSHRWIQTRATPTVFAGSRYKYMAPKIPFGYQEFVKALGEAIDKEQENGAMVVDVAPVDTYEKPSYEQLRTRAMELWNSLVGTGENADQEMAARVLKKVEMVFGRKIKLSEITEDQTDLYHLVVLDMEDMLQSI